jgi:dihydrolipoamide dehydrogenase
MLAHQAEDEGVIAAEVIAGKPVHMHYKSIPGVVYTWPEIAVVGLTERQVKESGREYRTGKFPFSANGRARSMGENTGFVKFVADAKTDELLGAHMIGPNVSTHRRSRSRVRVSRVVGGHRHGTHTQRCRKSRRRRRWPPSDARCI